MRTRTGMFWAFAGLVALVAGGRGLIADEGQWLPEQLRQLDWGKLRERGLELQPKEIWDGEAGLLSAAVNINGCSASFVSGDGLVLTNHHCGYAAINANSTTERNLLRDGFVAPGFAAELPARGYRVSIVRRIEDVTAQIHDAAEQAGDDPRARWEAVQRKVRELVAEGERQPNTSVIVTDYYQGREWRRIYRTEFQDVRLVYAPPAMVGEYGGDVDNWMWPRHTGDFSFFRAYVAPDGSPAPYHPNNVPYRPERWLEVSQEGVDAGDLVMVMGYPGRTERYLSSTLVAARESFFFPRRLNLYTRLLDAWQRATAASPEDHLKIASRRKSLANRQKNAEGMVWGLHRNQVVARKQAEEKELQAWIQSDPQRSELYGDVFRQLEALDFEEIARQERDFVLTEMVRRSAYLALGSRLLRFAEERGKQDLDRAQGYQQRDLPRLQAVVKGFSRSLVPSVEVETLAILLAEAQKLPDHQRLQGLDLWLQEVQREGESLQQLALRLVLGTRLNQTEFRMQLMQDGHPDVEDSRDPMLALCLSLSADLADMRAFQSRLAGMRMDVGARWIEAQQAWRGGRFYPDANRTLRVSFATVKGYEPRDGVFHTPFTSVEGMVAKHTGTEPFDLPDSVQKAARNRNLGAWTPNGKSSPPVCFLSDADTTGGNSGSPVVDGTGRLVGLNFDRVFENVAGDYGWNPARSRNIAVDLRFILWHLGAVMPAPRLLQEMGVVPALTEAKGTSLKF
ncbi:MAG: S46 family peptidase [Planctomycetota bacterium]|nr:MAG: S46 family peptidase [Planctomycetota bacterium]